MNHSPAQVSERNILQSSHVDLDAAKAITTFHSSIVEEVKRAVAKDHVVVVGMGQNPVVKTAKKTLDQYAIPYTYLGYGNYFSMWKPRLAIKLWSGWPTFPQVFVNGKLIGGNRELQAWIKAGKLYHKN